MNRILKLASLLSIAAAMLLSCEKTPVVGGQSSIKIPDLGVSFDKNVIRNNGETVTLKAHYKGEDVSDKATFYQVIEGEDFPQPISSRVFSSNTVGKYSFQVSYLTSFSDVVTISVVDQEIPDKVADPQPANTSFVHRTFFNQHTGAGCGYCPGMSRLLKETLADETIKNKVVLAAVRSYSGGEAGFASVPCPKSSWPFLHIDYATSYDYNKPKNGLIDIINERTATPAAVGISANPVYYSDAKEIIVRVTVKAAVKGEYNVGLWLLQDNYYKQQTDYLGIITGGPKDPYHYHDNCVRLAESKYLGAHIGYPLGMLDAGETRDWVFTFDLKSAIENGKNKGGWWESFSADKLDDLHFAAFVTSHSGAVYTVVNAVDFPYNTPAAFEYK